MDVVAHVEGRRGVAGEYLDSYHFCRMIEEQVIAVAAAAVEMAGEVVDTVLYIVGQGDEAGLAGVSQ